MIPNPMTTPPVTAPPQPWLLRFRVGPLPGWLYLILLALIFAASLVGRLPADIIGGFAAIMLIGWLLGDIGMHLPVLKHLGGPAILSLFVPSALVFYRLLNPDMMNAIVALMNKDKANFLYLYISCLVCGSILGMSRRILIQGFFRMFIPLLVGTLVAAAVGLGVGLCFGYAPRQTFFYIVVPILGGGIGEGILPYSLGMSEILKQPQSVFIPQLIPAAMLGNAVAIMCAGYLKRLGETRPQYSGQGLLVRTGDDSGLLKELQAERKIDFSLMGAGLLVACSLFVFGNLTSKYVGIPGPIIMIFTAALLKAFELLPRPIEGGTYLMYRFIATNLTWPLLVGLGSTLMPWKELVAAITPAYIVICASVVLAMITSGFFVGRLLKMYEVEAAIVTGCHSGLGGTGDVAILSAANRMELMPFAQISTRIGGATVVVVATLLLKAFT